MCLSPSVQQKQPPLGSLHCEVWLGGGQLRTGVNRRVFLPASSTHSPGPGLLQAVKRSDSNSGRIRAGHVPDPPPSAASSVTTSSATSDHVCGCQNDQHT